MAQKFSKKASKNTSGSDLQKHHIFRGFGAPGGGSLVVHSGMRTGTSGVMGIYHLGTESDDFPGVFVHSRFYCPVPPRGMSIT